jgi:hypothetical protein
LPGEPFRLRFQVSLANVVFRFSAPETPASGDLNFSFPFLLRVPPRTELVSFWECKGKCYLFFFQLSQPKFFIRLPPDSFPTPRQTLFSKGLQNYHLIPYPQIFPQLFFQHSAHATLSNPLFRNPTAQRYFIAIHIAKEDQEKLD